jgi:hypothetical protein
VVGAPLGWVRIAETKPTIARLQTAYKPDPTATLGGTASIGIMQADIQYGSQAWLLATATTGSPGGNARIFGVRSDTNGRTELTTTVRIDRNACERITIPFCKLPLIGYVS